MEPTPRVLLVNSHQAPNLVGGAETAVEHLAAALRRQGVTVGIAATTEGPAVREDASDGMARFHVPHGNLYLPLRAQRESRLQRLRWHLRDGRNRRAATSLAEVLARFKPTVVHTHNLAGFGPMAWQAARDAGLPIVHTMHDYYFVCPRTTVFRDGAPCESQCLECRAVSLRKRWADDLPDLLLSPSRFVADRHRALGWFRETPSRVVPNAMPEVTAEPRSGRTLRTVGFVGRIDPTKGVEILLEAARIVPELAVHVAGRGDPAYVDALKAKAPANVRFLGFVPDVEDFYRAVDAVVVPSVWHDVAPLVVREAQGRGIPVVGAEAGGIPELVEPGTGLLFRRGDPASLADALRGLAGADLAAMGRAGVEAYARARRQAVEGHLAAYAEVSALAAHESR